MNKNNIGIVFTTVLILSSLTSFSQDEKVYATKLVRSNSIVIDGKTDEPVWDKVEWSYGFIQHSPDNGNKPSQITGFKTVYDQKNIYVAIKAFDTFPDSISKRMARRDDMDGDFISVQFDSYNDDRTAFGFIVSVAGVRSDFIISENGDNMDFDWNPIWETKTNIESDGWVAEIRIPLSQLRFSNNSEQGWGLQIGRYIFRKEEISTWNFAAQDAHGWVSEFGQLQGIDYIKSEKETSITPYFVGKLETDQKKEENSFSFNKKYSMNGGLDGKFGITNNLILDFTINPDFGQVEADPSEVNLTAYETFFSEKRPFFIEGRNIMTMQMMPGGGGMGAEQIFYSRRIGRRPHYYPDLNDNEYISFPDNTDIIGAFKITGKTKNGWSVGILESVTSKEEALIYNSASEKYHSMQVEPLTNYFLTRLQKDNNSGNTIMGGMITATNRNINQAHLEYIHKSAYTGAVDFAQYFKDKKYKIEFKGFFSHVTGSEEAILNTQESSARYFQRPDADHLEIDSNLTSLTGTGGTLGLYKISDGHFNYGMILNWRSPGLELNDMGYLREADQISDIIWADYKYWEPIGIFRNIFVNFAAWSFWNFNFENLTTGFNIHTNLQFKNYWNFNAMIDYNGSTLSSSLLRGGPSFIIPSKLNMMLNIGTDSKKMVQFELGTFIQEGKYDFINMYNYFAEINFKPFNSITISLEPSLNFRKDELQYVDSYAYNNQTSYLLAEIDQTTLALSLRINVSLSPNLSIQYYGHPFISSGNYSSFKLVNDERNDLYKYRTTVLQPNQISYEEQQELYLIDQNIDGSTDYVFENPNFNFLEFKSNLVARWEFSPGSVIYLVWTQNRNDSYSSGKFDFRNDVDNLFSDYPYNVFLVKLSYRFGN